MSRVSVHGLFRAKCDILFPRCNSLLLQLAKRASHCQNQRSWLRALNGSCPILTTSCCHVVRLPSPGSSARVFFGGCLVCLLAAIGVAAYLTSRSAGQTCINNSICRGCSAFSDWVDCRLRFPPKRFVLKPEEPSREQFFQRPFRFTSWDFGERFGRGDSHRAYALSRRDKSKEPNPFAYDVSRFTVTDPKLICYERNACSTLPRRSPCAVALSANGNLFIGAGKFVSEVKPDGSLVSEFATTGNCALSRGGGRFDLRWSRAHRSFQREGRAPGRVGRNLPRRRISRASR